MGGNVFKQYLTTRLGRVRYFELVEEFSSKFLSVFPSSKLACIQSYANKPDFGDADFVVVLEGLPADWTQTLKAQFELNDTMYSKNGNVVSIGYKNFQIDLIVTRERYYHSSLFYFSYNDFGNLIGRMTHKLGIKLGHDGLRVLVRQHSNHIIKELELSTDWRDALDILGLDTATYLEGFDTLESMFEYVASSKFFDPEIYSLEHRSGTARTRDRKRSTYNQFLKWVADHKPPANHVFASKSELGGYSIREPYYTQVVVKKWPWAQAEVDAAIADFELDCKFRTVYNGDIVSSQTGLTGKELGQFMSKLKPLITDQVKQAWINQPACVNAAIAKHWIEQCTNMKTCMQQP